MTSGGRNSGDDELMAVIVRVHLPLLSRMSGTSRNDAMQTLPKLPVSAMTTLSRGDGAKPKTLSVCAPLGSLLNTVIAAEWAPSADGAKRSGTSSESPGPMARGYDATPGRSEEGRVWKECR